MHSSLIFCLLSHFYPFQYSVLTVPVTTNMSKARKSVYESTGRKNWRRSTHPYSCRASILQLRKVDFKNSEGKKMLMCLDYIKFLRLTKRKGREKVLMQEHMKRHYYITANAHKTLPIKTGWQFYILLNISKLCFNYKSFYMHVLTNMSLIMECSCNFLNAKHELYYIIQCQRKKFPLGGNHVLKSPMLYIYVSYEFSSELLSSNSI